LRAGEGEEEGDFEEREVLTGDAIPTCEEGWR